MTYKEAMEFLEVKYPGKFKSIKFERSMAEGVPYKTEISVYVEGKGWGDIAKNFHDAIANLDAPSDDEGGIDDADSTEAG